LRVTSRGLGDVYKRQDLASDLKFPDLTDRSVATDIRVVCHSVGISVADWALHHEVVIRNADQHTIMKITTWSHVRRCFNKVYHHFMPRFQYDRRALARGKSGRWRFGLFSIPEEKVVTCTNLCNVRASTSS
jgi:hypothetical protein